MRKQKRFILVLLILLAVLAAAAVIVWAVTKDKPEEGETTPPPTVTVEGEVVEGNYLLMYRHLAREELSSISVRNATGEYTILVSHDGTTSFTLKDASPIVTMEDTRISELVSVIGYTICSYYTDPEDKESPHRYVVTQDPAEFSRFGLAKEDEDTLPRYRVETTDGEAYTVYIGDALPNDGGYYVRLAGRDAVYVRSSSSMTVYGETLTIGFGETVLAPLRSFVVPYLTVNGGYAHSYIYVRNFFLTNPDGEGGQEIYLALDYLDFDERDTLNAAEVYAFIAPESMTAYTPDSEAYMYVLELLQEWRGEETMEVGITDEAGELRMEKLKKYGLDTPAHYLSYEIPWMAADDDIRNVKQYQQFLLLVSDLQPDGWYYVASPVCDIVARVSPEEVDFLSWQKFTWIDSYVFPYSIGFLERLKITAGDADYDFRVTHTGVSDLAVVDAHSGKTVDDIPNFKKLYSVLVSMWYEGDARLTDDELADITGTDANTVVTVSLTLSDGRHHTYRFFAYSAQKCLVSLDGSCEFYTLNAVAKKIVRAADALMRGEKIDHEERYE